MSLFKESQPGSSPAEEVPQSSQPEQKPNISMPDVGLASSLDATIAAKEKKLRERRMSDEDREALQRDIERLKKTNRARKGYIEKGL